MPALAAADRPKHYPDLGAKLRHAHCAATGTVVKVGPHSEAHKTRQRAITIRTSYGDERVFEMSVKNFWFNWTEA